MLACLGVPLNAICSMLYILPVIIIIINDKPRTQLAVNVHPWNDNDR